MWNTYLIIQAIAWIVLLLSMPFAFIYIKKTVTYLSYKIVPRDTIIQINNNDRIETAYYVRIRPFGKSSIRELSEKELSNLEGRS